MIAQVYVNGISGNWDLVVPILIAIGIMMLAGGLLRGQSRAIYQDGRDHSLYKSPPRTGNKGNGNEDKRIEEHRRCGCRVCLQIIADHQETHKQTKIFE